MNILPCTSRLRLAYSARRVAQIGVHPNIYIGFKLISSLDLAAPFPPLFLFPIIKEKGI